MWQKHHKFENRSFKHLLIIVTSATFCHGSGFKCSSKISIFDVLLSIFQVCHKTAADSDQLFRFVQDLRNNLNKELQVWKVLIEARRHFSPQNGLAAT